MAGDGGAFRQVAARGGGTPSAGGGSLLLLRPHVFVVIASVGSARMRRVRASPTRSALLPRGRPTRTRQRVARSTRVAHRAGPSLADDQAVSSQFPGTARSSMSGRPPDQPHPQRPGGSQSAGWVSTSARPTPQGQHDPVLLRGSSSVMARGSTCEVASWLIVRPSAAREPAHGAPPRHALRALRRPLIQRGAHTPGPDQARARRTGSASRAHSLRGAHRCTEHPGDACLAQPRLQFRTDRSPVPHTQRLTTPHTAQPETGSNPMTPPVFVAGGATTTPLV